MAEKDYSGVVLDSWYPDTPVETLKGAEVPFEGTPNDFYWEEVPKKPKPGVSLRSVIDNGNDLIRQANVSGTLGASVHFVLSRKDFSGQYYGTGAYVSPNVILTCAHNFLVTKDGAVTEDIRETCFPTYYLGENSAMKNNGLTWQNTSGKNMGFATNKVFFFDKDGYVKNSKRPDYTFFDEKSLDLCAIVVNSPLQFDLEGAEPYDLPQNNRDVPNLVKKNTNISFVGYPVTKEKADMKDFTRGELYKVNTKVRDVAPSGIIGTAHSTFLAGMSGAPLINTDSNVVVGVGVASTPYGNVLAGTTKYENQNALYAVLDPQRMEWLKGVINANKVVGWKENGGKRYYFKDDGHLIKGQRVLIGDRYYTFDNNGVMTKEEEPEKESFIYADYLDEENNPIIPRALIYSGKQGVKYSVPRRDFPNYNFVGLGQGSLPETGTAPVGNRAVIFRYTFKRGNLRVRYLTDSGTQVFPERLTRNLKYGHTETLIPPNHNRYTVSPATQSVTINQAEVAFTFVYTLKGGGTPTPTPGGDTGGGTSLDGVLKNLVTDISCDTNNSLDSTGRSFTMKWDLMGNGFRVGSGTVTGEVSYVLQKKGNVAEVKEVKVHIKEMKYVRNTGVTAFGVDAKIKLSVFGNTVKEVTYPVTGSDGFTENINTVYIRTGPFAITQNPTQLEFAVLTDSWGGDTVDKRYFVSFTGDNKVAEDKITPWALRKSGQWQSFTTLKVTMKVRKGNNWVERPDTQHEISKVRTAGYGASRIRKGGSWVAQGKIGR